MNDILPAPPPSPGDVDPVACPNEEPHEMHPWNSDGGRPEFCAGVLPKRIPAERIHVMTPGEQRIWDAGVACGRAEAEAARLREELTPAAWLDAEGDVRALQHWCVESNCQCVERKLRDGWTLLYRVVP